MDYFHSQDMLDFHQCRDLFVLLHCASKYTFLLAELRNNGAFQLKGRTQIHNRVIFLLKKADDRFTTELHKVISGCRGQMKTSLLLKNFHQMTPFCIWNF